MTRIYSRRGDNGTSTLFDGKRRMKNSNEFEILGTIDELNSSLGIVRCSLKNDRLNESEEILKIQKCLMNLQSSMGKEDYRKTENNDKFNDEINRLEELIDRYTSELPKLKNFIIPGDGEMCSSYAHFSRTICRRLERSMSRDEQLINDSSFRYVNRLSDYLFMLARRLNEIDRIYSSKK
ncbi:hypothetical protein SNEBB_000219 [Seison nebaliae]|nr:hypothetical protein SNEBB_000219 [Seison nebaliae]